MLESLVPVAAVRAGLAGGNFEPVDACLVPTDDSAMLLESFLLLKVNSLDRDRAEEGLLDFSLFKFNASRLH